MLSYHRSFHSPFSYPIIRSLAYRYFIVSYRSLVAHNNTFIARPNVCLSLFYRSLLLRSSLVHNISFARSVFNILFARFTLLLTVLLAPRSSLCSSLLPFYYRSSLVPNNISLINSYRSFSLSLVRSSLCSSLSYPYITVRYLFDISQYILLPLYSFIRLFVYSFDVIHTLGLYS